MIKLKLSYEIQWRAAGDNTWGEPPSGHSDIFLVAINENNPREMIRYSVTNHLDIPQWKTWSPDGRTEILEEVVEGGEELMFQIFKDAISQALKYEDKELTLIELENRVSQLEAKHIAHKDVWGVLLRRFGV